MAIMKESETDQILYSNIFYLKQFMPNKMGGEVLILQNSLIPNSLRAQPIVQCCIFWQLSNISTDMSPFP